MKMTLRMLLLLGAMAGCATAPQPVHPRIETILVQRFMCSDEIIAAAVQNVFVEVLSRHANVRVVREGIADVVIEGTITFMSGLSSKGSAGGAGGNGVFAVHGSGSSAAGDYVAGVTALATSGGDVIASANWAQALGGGKLVPPETVAKVAATILYEQLTRVGLEKR